MGLEKFEIDMFDQWKLVFDFVFDACQLISDVSCKCCTVLLPDVIKTQSSVQVMEKIPQCMIHEKRNKNVCITAKTKIQFNGWYQSFRCKRERHSPELLQLFRVLDVDLLHIDLTRHVASSQRATVDVDLGLEAKGERTQHGGFDVVHRADHVVLQKPEWATQTDNITQYQRQYRIKSEDSSRQD
jgi:hypothetical protein